MLRWCCGALRFGGAAVVVVLPLFSGAAAVVLRFHGGAIAPIESHVVSPQGWLVETFPQNSTSSEGMSEAGV